MNLDPHPQPTVGPHGEQTLCQVYEEVEKEFQKDDRDE